MRAPPSIKKFSKKKGVIKDAIKKNDRIVRG